MLQRFLKEWIPMEEIYFKENKIQNQCDISLEYNI